MTTLDGYMEAIYARLGDLERRARNRKRTGTITAVDNAKGLARVDLGGGLITRWSPWGEIAAGGIKTHIPPTVGQQVDVLSENGDLTDSVISMSIPSNANPRPHDGPEAVISYGGTRLEIGDGIVTITADVEINGALSIVGPRVEHNGTNIGDTHVHSGVVSGGADTATPH